jgi:hypothetical protein
MVKEKQTPQENPLVAMLMNNLKENFIGKAISVAKEKIKKLQKMTLELAVSMIFFVMAIFFMLGALMLCLKEYFLLSYSVSFFVTGIVAMLIAYVLYKFAIKE